MNFLPLELPPLETRRLLLRAMTPLDVEALFAIYGDPEVMRYASDNTFSDRGVIHLMLASVREQLLTGESLEWGMVDKATGQLIGTAGFHSFDSAAGSAEVGCMLARAAWGRDLMAEALVELFRYAKTTLLLKTVRADIDAPNARSIRLFTKLGFAHQQGIRYERAL